MMLLLQVNLLPVTAIVAWPAQVRLTKRVAGQIASPCTHVLVHPALQSLTMVLITNGLLVDASTI